MDTEDAKPIDNAPQIAQEAVEEIPRLPDGPKPLRPLTAKIQRFCDEYIIDLNASAAAKRAGYSEKTADRQGHRLLKKVEVDNYIKQLMEKREERTTITQDYVLKGITELIERCIQAVPVFDKEGNETGEYRMQATAAFKGYELLGRHMKMWTDKVEHGGIPGQPIEIKDAEKITDYSTLERVYRDFITKH